MDIEEIQKRASYIAKLDAMGFNYNYDRFTTDQLFHIYMKSMRERKDLCKDIAILGREVGKHYDTASLYRSHMHRDELRGLRTRLQSQVHRLKIVNQIEQYANALDKDTKFVAENMFKGHKTTEDLEYVLYKLGEEVYSNQPVNSSFQDTIHYDANYALGDDPILDQIDIETVIPQEKVEEIVNTLDKIKRRRKKKSIFLDRVSKKDYEKRMAKFRNLEENYKLLDTYDFNWLISVYNQATESLADEFEDINENEYTRHI